MNEETKREILKAFNYGYTPEQIAAIISEKIDDIKSVIKELSKEGE